MPDLNSIPVIEVEVLPTVFVGGGEGADLTSHLAAIDPHPQYLTQTEGDSRYRQLGNIPASEVTGTLGDSQIPASIARDSEVTAAIAAITPATIGAEAAAARTLTPTATDPGNTSTVSGFLSWLLQAVRGAQTTLSGLGALAFKSSISDGDVASGAGIALSKLATDPLARTNHTGTQAMSTVTGLQTALDGKADLTTLTTLRNEVGMIGTAYTNTSAANAAAVLVIPAPGAGLSLQLNQLIFGYNNDPTNGLLTVQQGATVIQSVPVTSKGTGPIVVGVKLATNTALTITLSAGGAGVVGSINASVSVV